MKKLKSTDRIFRFNKQIYSQSPIFITSDQFWDGGIKTDSSLKEKTAFYSISAKMSDIIRDMISVCNETVYIGKSLCEHEEIYAHWSDLKSYELFQRISELIRPKHHYEISLPEDSHIIDLIVESNFKYFSYIALYFPKSDMILLPTCHTEIIIYTMCPQRITKTLETIIAKYSDDQCKIICKR